VAEDAEQFTAPTDEPVKTEQAPVTEGAKSRKISVSTRARRIQLIGSLFSGMSLGEAAEAAGMSPRTASRLRKTREFEELYCQVEQECLRSAVALLHKQAADFARVLAEIANDKSARPGERVRASDCGLTQFFRASEILQLEERLQRLEETLRERE